MKRLATLLLAAGLVFGAANTAQAVEFKGSGFFHAYFTWSDALENQGPFGAEAEQSSDRFRPAQRVRIKLDMIASENLRAVFQIENDILWGNSTTGGQLGGDRVAVEVKHAYLDWVIPQTDVQVRMGLQPFLLPSMAMGTAVFDDDATGIVVSKTFNEYVAATLFWMRTWADNTSISDSTAGVNFGSSDGHDAADFFGLTLPLTFDGFNVTPWFMIGVTGENIGSWYRSTPNSDVYTGGGGVGGSLRNYPDATIWFAGITAELVAFDPFRFAIDFNYGSADTDARLATSPTTSISAETDGFYVGAIAEYKFDMVTPGLYAWYASGNDAGEDGGGVMPVINGGWRGTSFGFADYVGSGNNSVEVIGDTPVGTWGIGLQFKNLSFMEDMTHMFRVAYYEGTNEADANSFYQGYTRTVGLAEYMTDDDSAWEINLNTKYDIYENLAFILELGYISADWDIENGRKDDAYRANAVFAYSF